MVEAIFHGTTEEFVSEQIEKYGVYRHEGKRPIFLTQIRGYAIEHAKLRASDWGGTPALTAIDKSEIDIENLEGEVWPSCKRVGRNSFALGRIIEEGP